jgi:hypothetical protein
MRYLFSLVTLFGAIVTPFQANAGEAKLTWTHDNRAVDGSTVTLTGFNFYWNVNGGAVTRIQYGPPAALPWKVVAGMYYYSKTFMNDAWVPGATVCFRATAVAGTLESDQSGQVCKVMPSDPTAPVIIEIDPKP